MVNYTCTTCSKQFNRKSNYDYHINNKKKPCLINNLKKLIFTQNTQENIKNTQNFELTEQAEDVKIVTFDCEYCKKSFGRKYNLDRHLNNCKIKKSQDEEKKLQSNQLDELKKLILEQSKQIEELKKQKTNNITINNNTTTTNNTDNSVKNNINLMAHGSEDFSKIELPTILKYLCSENFESIVPNVTREIFRNKNRPEFLNFEVTDLARNKSRLFDGNKWIIGNAEDGVARVFENVNSTIVEPFEEENIISTIKYIDKNEELRSKAQWINWGKNFCCKLFNEDDKEYVEHKNKICENIKHMMYNTKCSDIK